MSSTSQSSGPSSAGSRRPHPPRGTRPTGRGTGEPSRRAGLIPLGIALLGIAELALLIVIGVNTSLWWCVLIVVVGWIVGVALVVAAGQQSFVRLRSLLRAVRGDGDVQDHLSRPAFTLLAALCFFFPGLITALIGVILLIVPVQRRTVRAMGVGSGSDSARSVLYRRRSGGVIDGEIIVDARPTDRTDGEDGREGGQTPPTITQS
ncbi:FxsA family protein [Brachybacterium squillarum]|uniref:FxsA family protein n=1 Tax=Brachybacterium squillarum TaxID=661979 RepID=UPI00026297F6|nr:FxsA family protein [Brachybacterium squillarum]